MGKITPPPEDHGNGWIKYSSCEPLHYNDQVQGLHESSNNESKSKEGLRKIFAKATSNGCKMIHTGHSGGVYFYKDGHKTDGGGFGPEFDAPKHGQSNCAVYVLEDKGKWLACERVESAKQMLEDMSLGGRYAFFLSHTQRDNASMLMASDIRNTMEKKYGLESWMDVEMEDRSEQAMKDGVENSSFFIACITDDGTNPYWSRPYCKKEFQWAVDNGKTIIPVIRIEDVSRRDEFMTKMADEGLPIGNYDIKKWDRSNPDDKEGSCKNILRAAGFDVNCL